MELQRRRVCNGGKDFGGSRVIGDGVADLGLRLFSLVVLVMACFMLRMGGGGYSMLRRSRGKGHLAFYLSDSALTERRSGWRPRIAQIKIISIFRFKKVIRSLGHYENKRHTRSGFCALITPSILHDRDVE